MTTLPAGRSFVIRLERIDSAGTPWIVRLMKKGFLFRRRISSDWFLDGDQAKKFAEQLSSDLTREGATVDFIRSRKPGWTLHQAAR